MNIVLIIAGIVISFIIILVVIIKASGNIGGFFLSSKDFSLIAGIIAVVIVIPVGIILALIHLIWGDVRYSIYENVFGISDGAFLFDVLLFITVVFSFIIITKTINNIKEKRNKIDKLEKLITILKEQKKVIIYDNEKITINEIKELRKLGIKLSDDFKYLALNYGGLYFEEKDMKISIGKIFIEKQKTIMDKFDKHTFEHYNIMEKEITEEEKEYQDYIWYAQYKKGKIFEVQYQERTKRIDKLDSLYSYQPKKIYENLTDFISKVCV